MNNRFRQIASTLLVGLFLAGSAGAREDNGMMQGGGATAGLSNGTTQAVVKVLTRGGRECGGLRKIYRFDCFRFVYKQAADLLAGIPAYREALKALAEVEKALEQQVAQNVDPTVKPKRRGFATYRAVKPAAVPKVQAASVAAMQQAETVLLRSDEKKQLHYVKIADAVGSNKVLLRSALLLIPGIGVLAVLVLV